MKEQKDHSPISYSKRDDSQLLFKGGQIEIDLGLMRFKRDSDNNWMKLPKPSYLALTQRKMSQRGGLRTSFVTHSYHAFCVYLKAGKLNILAFTGSRDKVEKEAEALSRFLQVKVLDLFPRDDEGNVIDDDYGSNSSNILLVIAILLIVIFLTLGFLFG